MTLKPPPYFGPGAGSVTIKNQACGQVPRFDRQVLSHGINLLPLHRSTVEVPTSHLLVQTPFLLNAEKEALAERLQFTCRALKEEKQY